jgi:hypothetical protein
MIANDVVSQFEVKVPGEELSDLNERLSRTRYIAAEPDAGWEAGMPVEFLRSLLAYWRDEFDWRKLESKINSFANLKVAIDGLNVHCVHIRGAGPDTVPIVLVHGWPSSFVEHLDLGSSSQTRLVTRHASADNRARPQRLSRRIGRVDWREMVVVDGAARERTVPGPIPHARPGPSTIALYWHAQTINSANWGYYRKVDRGGTAGGQANVPVGVALTTQPIDRSPRVWAERFYPDIRRWADLGAGGHFVAMEQPALVAAAIRDFVRPLRG